MRQNNQQIKQNDQKRGDLNLIFDYVIWQLSLSTVSRSVFPKCDMVYKLIVKKAGQWYVSRVIHN